LAPVSHKPFVFAYSTCWYWNRKVYVGIVHNYAFIFP